MYTWTFPYIDYEQGGTDCIIGVDMRISNAKKQMLRNTVLFVAPMVLVMLVLFAVFLVLLNRNVVVPIRDDGDL